MTQPNSTPIHVTLDAAAVEKQLVEAITNAALGKNIAAAIDDAVRRLNLGSYFDNHLQKIVESEMRRIIAEVVREKFEASITAQVVAHLTPEWQAKVARDLFERLNRERF